MIVRETTDIDEVGAWTKTQLEAWGHEDVTASAELYRKDTRYRFFGAWEKDLIALMIALPLKTDRGPGWNVVLFMATENLPDHHTVLGKLALYVVQTALSEGATLITSRVRTPQGKREDLIAFGVNELGLTLVEPDYLEGDAQEMVAFMLKRHPEWSF